MGEQQHSLNRVTTGNPSWVAVVVTTFRLWLERHHRRSPWSAARRRRAVLILSALAAMAAGVLITLGVTANQTAARAPSGQPTDTAQNSSAASALQVAAANRNSAAAWIAQQILPSVLIGCDSLMCDSLEAAGVSASRLSVIQTSTPDPLGVEVIVATPALQSQFGPRLSTVYAPLTLASFGSGTAQIDVRYVVPGGTTAFEQSLAPAQQARVDAGEQLLTNKNVQATAQARQALLAGDVDPRLLVTLGLLAHEMPLKLLAFDDSSPGASPEVPLRGAEIGAPASASLSAMLAFLAQQTTYQPSQYHETRTESGQVVTVQYDAPGPLGLSGP
jgi:hypothetical protein